MSKPPVAPTPPPLAPADSDDEITQVNKPLREVYPGWNNPLREALAVEDLEAHEKEVLKALIAIFHGGLEMMPPKQFDTIENPNPEEIPEWLSASMIRLAQAVMARKAVLEQNDDPDGTLDYWGGKVSSRFDLNKIHLVLCRVLSACIIKDSNE